MFVCVCDCLLEFVCVCMFVFVHVCLSLFMFVCLCLCLFCCARDNTELAGVDDHRVSYFLSLCPQDVVFWNAGR